MTDGLKAGALTCAALAVAACGQGDQAWRSKLAERQELIAQIRAESGKIQSLESELARRGVPLSASAASRSAQESALRLGAFDDEAGSSSNALPWTLVGVGGAALIAGTATAFAASSKQAKLHDECAEPAGTSGVRYCDASLGPTRNNGRSLATASYVLWGIGGASAVLGVTLLIVNANDEPAAAWSAACQGDGCQLSLSGRF